MLFLTYEKIYMYMRYESYATPGKKLIIQISVKGLSLKGMCWERRKIGDLSQFRSLRSLTGSVLHYSYLEIRKWAGEAEEYSINHSKLRPEPKSFRNIGSHLETFIPIGGEGKRKGKKKTKRARSWIKSSKQDVLWVKTVKPSGILPNFWINCGRLPGFD